MLLFVGKQDIKSFCMLNNLFPLDDEGQEIFCEQITFMQRLRNLYAIQFNLPLYPQQLRSTTRDTQNHIC